MRQNSRLFFIKPSLLLLIIAVAGFIFGSSFFTKRATGETSAFAPNLSATKAAALDTSAGGDLNGNGIVNPGDRLTYTVTIQNNGDQPATGVNFSDTIDANTTYQAGSMIASPVAVNDVYSSIGNVGINVTDGAGDLLGNDFDANSPAVPNLTISNVNTAGTQGAVNVNTATGSFTFNPNPGFEGPTTFSYTLSNGTGLTDTATVTINVSGMIWFVNAAAGSGGDGRLSSPFNCFVGTNCFDDATGDEAGDNIFLYSGSYTGGQTLLTNQRLIGQGATTALTGAGSITGIIVPPFSNALPSTGGTNPNVTTSAAATNGINIVSGNTVRGLSVTTTTGAGISGANVTNATIGADVSISGASGAAFELGGNASGTIGFGAGVTNTSGRAISIQNRTGGTVDLTGAVSDSGGTGILLNANTGATINLTGGVTLNGATSTFTATGGGTINLTGTNIIGNSTAATGAGLTIQNTTIGASGVTFQRISITGGSKGIVLNNTGAGAFTVTGTDGGDAGTLPDAGTGGTIQNTTARGAEFINASGISLGGINFTNATTTDGTAAVDCGNAFQTAGNKNCNAPVYFDTVTNAALRTVDVNGSVQTGIVGYDVNGLTMDTVTVRNGGDNIAENGGAAFRNLGGASSILNSSFRDNTRAQFDITNNAGTTTGNISFLNNEFTGNRAPNLSAQGLLVVNAGTMGTLSIGDGTPANDNNFHDSFSNGFQYSGNPGGSTVTININRNSFTNTNSGVVLQAAGVGAASTLNYSVENNTLVAGALTGSGAIITSATQGHLLNGMIRGNTIGTSGVANSGAVCNSCNGITVDHDGFGRHDVSIIGNIVQRIKSIGIYYQVADASGNVVITGNLVREPEGNPSNGIYVQSGTLAADNGCVAATLGGTTNSGFPSTAANSMNSVQGSWDPAGSQSEIFVWRRFATTMNLPGLSSGENAWIAARNNIPDATGADVTVSGTPFGSAASCGSPLASHPSEGETSIVNKLALSHLWSSEIAIPISLFTEYTTDKPVETPRANYLETTATFFSDASSTLSEFAGKLDSLIVSTAQAQKSKNETIAPESGENVSKNLGTLPNGEQIVVQFKATVDANIPINDFSVANTANITANGGININSTTATTTVVHPPTVSKAFGAPFIALNGTTSLTFTIGNANPSTAFTNVAFSDTLPAGMVIATPNGLVNNCGGGTITAVQNTGVFSVSGLSRAANSTCAIVIDVTAPTEGAKNNTTTAISSTQGGTGLTSNTAALNVITAPSFTKAFGAPSIPLNGTTALTFTITNNSPAFALNNVSFTDILPAGLIVATPPNQTGSCGGTITANQGAGTISLSGATLAASASCSFSVDVTGTTAGAKNNSATLSTTELGSIPTASATLTVVAPPTITKAFSPTTILQNNGFSTMSISISNPAANTVALTGVGVTDNFPPGLEVDAAPTATNSCATGTFTTTVGVGSVSISGAAIPVNTTCTFGVRVRGTSVGPKVNTTDAVTSANGGPGLTASATVTVTNTITWTGTVSSNWNMAANWSPQFVPASTNDVDIPSGALPNNPVISASDVTASNLTESAGRILTIDAGRTLTVTSACTINGTMNVAGAFSCGSLVSGGTINFTGAAAQNIPALTYNNFGVNNPSGVTLAGDVTIDGTLTLTSGNIDAGINTLTIGAGGSVTRTNGHVLGTLKKTFAGGGPLFTYPVGTTGAYSPVSVTVTAGVGDLSVKANAGTAPAAPAINDATTLDRYWTLEGSGITSDVTFNYLAADVDGNEAAYNILRAPSAGGGPVIRYAPNGTTVILDAANNFFTVKDLSVYSNWTAGEPFAPTAASVSIGGRVADPDGRAVSNAQISMVDINGNIRIARTNPFGYYRFFEIPAGASYMVSITHKQFEFEPRVISVMDDSEELDFVASP